MPLEIFAENGTKPVVFSQKTYNSGLNACITGLGLTVIVKALVGFPAQTKLPVVYVGVMFTVAVNGAVPLLTVVKLGIVLVLPAVGVSPTLEPVIDHV